MDVEAKSKTYMSFTRKGFGHELEFVFRWISIAFGDDPRNVNHSDDPYQTVVDELRRNVDVEAMKSEDVVFISSFPHVIFKRSIT